MGWGKLSVFNLGQAGVNVDSDVIHVEAGECQKLQNMILDPAGVLGGIRKRDGMSVFNTSALAGSIKGFQAIPFPDISSSKVTRTFYESIENGGANPAFRTSTDGSTWADLNATPIQLPQQQTKLGTFATGSGAAYVQSLKWQGIKYLDGLTRLIYPGNDYTSPADGGTATQATLHIWDGTNDFLLCKIPDNPYAAAGTHIEGVLSIVPYDLTHILVSTYDDTTGNGRSRILLVDITTGASTQIAPGTDVQSVMLNPFVFRGQIWCGQVNTGGGATSKVVKARTTDSTWTTDFTTDSSHGYVIDMIAFKGDLYIGQATDATQKGQIQQRLSSTGAYTVVDSTDGTSAGAYEGPFIVSQDGSTLYAGWYSANGAAPIIKIRKTTNGTAWSDEQSVVALSSTSFTASGRPFLDTNGDIYWPWMAGTPTNSSVLLKRAASNGTWSKVDDLSAGPKGCRGPLGVVIA